MLSSSSRRGFAVPFAAILLLEIAWAAALPLFRGPDEISHVYRASAVAVGQWEASGGDTPTRVETDLVRAASEVCHELYDEELPTVCEPTVDHGDGTVGIHSTADTYNPAYYAVAGAPARLLDGTAAGWGMRLMSAVLCAALLAWAWVLSSGSRTAFPTLGLALASTPAVLFAGSVVAPNGLHYASALLLWAALIATHRGTASARTAATAAAVGGVTLLLTHTTGPLWLATILLVMLVVHGVGATWQTLRGAPRAWGAATIAIASAATATVLWTLTTAATTASPGGEPLADETKDIGLLPNVILWLLQTIGTMPYRFGLVWMMLYALWLIPIGALLVWGLRRSRPRFVVASLLALGLSMAIPGVLTVISYAELGYAWQGRYGLPLLFGVVLLAAEGLDRTVAPAALRLLVPIIGTLAVTHYLFILCVGLRESSGPFDDGRPWLVLLGVVAPLCVAAAYGALGTMAHRVGRNP